MNLDKPHYGTINNWYERQIELKKGLGYIIVGRSDGHPSFHGGPIYTSYVVAREGNEIETRNSRYTLGTQAEQPRVDKTVAIASQPEFHRFHLLEDTVTLTTVNGKMNFGAGWLLMSEAEYAHLTKLAYGKEPHV